MERTFGGGEKGREEDFAVSPHPESAAVSWEFESLNVCRVAGLSALLSGDPGATEGVATALEEMGFPPTLTTGRRNLWVEDPGDVLAEIRMDIAGESRPYLWASTQENPDPRSTIGFLLAVLGSPLERESVAAAAALWRLLNDRRPSLRQGPISLLAMEREEGEARLREWNERTAPSAYQRMRERLLSSRRPTQSLRSFVEQRLRHGLRSPDPLTVSLASAAGLPAVPLPLEPPPQVGGAEVEGGKAPKAASVSTMIHGTWGWRGDWWRPSGGFHRFVRGSLRSNLYARGARFSWSGFYRESHRVRACTDFREWSEEIAPNGFQSVFGHSYGGEVAARAVTEGTPVEELVLLSAPVTDEVVAAVNRGIRVVDVRLRFDPVLALARTGQKLPTRSNVTTVRLKRWTLDHSATHDERIWVEEDIASRAGM